MRPIVPHLWFDTEARQAAELYTSVLPGSAVTDVTVLRGTPSGDCDVVSFTLAGQPFQAISAGPLFRFNPSISFRIDCATPDEVDATWNALHAETLMPLDSYPFSKRYGWLQDRYGLSWQVMHSDAAIEQKVVPMLMFVGDAAGSCEEAIGHYTSVFDDASVGDIMRWGPGAEPEVEGTVQYAPFTIEGYDLAGMDSANPGHDFAFNEAISLMVYCDTQAEMDRFSDALSAVPEAEQCGWLKDRFGVSWQVVPAAFDQILRNADEETLARVTQAFLPMKRLDIATLERAAAGTA